jgi:tetrahydromethanopterin S-methyltransferase subunit F
MELKSIDPISCGVVKGLVCAVIGLIFGVLTAISALSIPFVGAGIGLFSVIVTPILGFIIGFVACAAFALIYNFVVKYITKRGIKLELVK